MNFHIAFRQRRSKASISPAIATWTHVHPSCVINNALQPVCGTTTLHQLALPPLSDDSDDDTYVWPTSKELALSAYTKTLPNPETRSFPYVPLRVSAWTDTYPSVEMDTVYMIAYDIRSLRHHHPPMPGQPIVAWTLGYALSNEDLICMPRIVWDRKQRSWIGTSCTWTWTGIHQADNVLLVIKLGDPRTIELNDFLGLVRPPYEQRIVHLAAGRQYFYVRLMREHVMLYIEALGGTMETVADDFLDDIRRFTHLVKAGQVAHVSLHVFV
ncbi:hypothetical protein CALCODRAFT_558681 [Calocera cornea HHB12733]|uniref:Uncharacterized protein n=1 Tax=Calocera cornea HHB12733 TaxID=1353952 RepID=A0A165CSP8_9BASI|nr:hypothetical protein CALCODRAFT_558681 [Calocera cornea HHB12733]